MESELSKNDAARVTRDRLLRSRFFASLWVSMVIAAVAPLGTLAQECGTGFDIILGAELPNGAVALEKVAPGAQTLPNASPIGPADVAVAPFNLAGRFLSSVDGERRYCTAQLTGAGDILLTAAHCVRNKNGAWLNEFTFEPNTETREELTISDVVAVGTLQDWVTSSDGDWHWPSDFAFILLRDPISEQALVLAAPPLSELEATTIGFPLDIGGGQVMQVTSGRFLRTEPKLVDAALGEDHGAVLHGNPQFGLGVSGGGWLIPPVQGSHDFRVIGLNAYGWPFDLPGGTAGAAFGSCAPLLMKVIEGQREVHD